ncbi:unnamed protein product [Cylicocyclus nassatus]|uniref:AN1-type domain-containing protein n=1 Tax=Cylicocyclus nassatus TaxID=53992 RepID=A0AA36GTG6_CYLNA|nr:unnamed protein product [Cylicocyclus nassatus]
MTKSLSRNYEIKKLLRKRRRLNILSPAPSRGSVLSLSPVESQTPDEGSKLNDTIVAMLSAATENMQELSEKELQCFFEPPESQEELELQQSELFVPPESVEELNQVKMKRDIELKTICKMCHQKLSLAEQEIKCLCQQVFCKRHRAPAAHLCPIDYKQTGRSRIFKENSKPSCRRTHRVPMSE